MKFSDWRGLKGLLKLVATPRLAPEKQAERIVSMQLHIVLPIKAGVLAVMLYFLFFSDLHYGPTHRQDILEIMQRYFPIYVLGNVIAGAMLFSWRKFAPGIFLWLVFTLGLLDGIFMTGVTFITGGFGSIAYWVFPGLIVLNAVSIPLATPQIMLNLLLSAFYLSAGILDAEIPFEEMTNRTIGGRRIETAIHHTNSLPAVSLTNQPAGALTRTNRPGVWNLGALPYVPSTEETSTEPFLARLFVLWLLTACCYGVQVLAERQRQAIEETREFALREGQLHSAGRLAAEFAHQIKNPLAIINSAVYSMQRALRDGRDVGKQLEMIREEVERSDKIVTQIMGYAQLSEGRVEKLHLPDELDYAIRQVFPPVIGYNVDVRREYGADFPPMVMQRQHLAEILTNILTNAREAINGRDGRVSIAAGCPSEAAVEVIVGDNGPGIAPDKLERIFEAYYTTKEKGTGLGLAIVKHNMELYGGTVRAESELGKGARFILTFPAKAVMSLPKDR